MNIEAAQHDVITTVGDGSIRLLFIDDNDAVVQNFIEAAQRICKADQAGVSFQFWHYAANNPARNAQTLLNHLRALREASPFSALFIDGNLGNGPSGPEIAEAIRQDNIENIKPFEFLPIAILTSKPKNYSAAVLDQGGLRLMAKSGAPAKTVLRRILAELPDLRQSMRARVWSELHKLADSDPEARAEVVIKTHLAPAWERHLGVKHWYVRLEEPGGHIAIAMNDGFEAGQTLLRENLPQFFKAILEKQEGVSTWRSGPEGITEADWAGFPGGTVGAHAAVARLGGEGDDVIGYVSLYRDAGDQPFTGFDCSELHYLGAQVHRRLQREARKKIEAERQTALVKAVTKIVQADSSRVAIDQLTDTLWKLVTQEITGEHESKVAARLLKRGTDQLVRWGEPDSSGAVQPKGSLKSDHGPISLGDKKSAYARVMSVGKTQYIPNIPKNEQLPDNRRRPYACANKRARSALTVPLQHRGTVIGAVNIETEKKGAFVPGFIRRAETLAELTTVAILARRMRNFARNLAEAAATWAAQQQSPGDVTQAAVSAVYRLCGFSDLLILEPSAPGQSYTVKEAWQGGDTGLIRSDARRRDEWQKHINMRWTGSFTQSFIDDEFKRTGWFTNAQEHIAPDDGEGEPRPGRPTRAMLCVRADSKGADGPVPVLTMSFENKHPYSPVIQDALIQFSAFIGLIFERDIAEQKRLGDELISRQLVTLGRIFGQYRHEIMGQLAALDSGLELAELRGETAEQRLALAKEEIRHIAGTAETGGALVKTPEPKCYAIAPLWNEMAAFFGSSARKNNQTIRQCDSDYRYKMDKDIVQKIVFFHLMQNFSKYAGEGAVLELKCYDNAIHVEDDGGGIHIENGKNIFDIGVTTGLHSTGMGLYLVRGRLQDMGSAIELEDPPADNRTRFIISLERCQES